MRERIASTLDGRKLAAFARQSVALLCVAQTFAVLGEHVFFWNGLSLWAYDHMGGTRGIGITLFIVTFPALLSYPAGRIVGNLPARRTLIVCGTVRLAFILFLLLCVFLVSGQRFSNGIGFWKTLPVERTLVLGLAALTVLVDSFFMPALKASLPAWSGGTQALIDRANALLEATDAPGFVCGPPVAAFVYEWIGLSGLVITLALAYGVALTLLVRLPHPAPQEALKAESMSIHQNQIPYLGMTVPLCVSALSMLILGIVQTVALPFVCEVLRQPDSMFGILTASMGLGVVLGAVLWSLAPILSLPIAFRLVLFLSIAGAALLFGAKVSSAMSCGIAWFLGGTGFSGITLALTTYFQSELTPAKRAGSLGLAHTLEAAGLLIGEFVAPLIVLREGLRGAFQCGGVLFLVIASGVTLWSSFAALRRR